MYVGLTYNSFSKACATKVDERKEPYRELRGLSYSITSSCIQDDAVKIFDDMADLDRQWRELLNRLNHTKKNVDDNHRASKKFFGSYDDMITFMNEADKQLKSEENIGADPVVLKLQLKKHKVILLKLSTQYKILQLQFKLIYLLLFCRSSKARLVHSKPKWTLL